jgi:hypothetical protein
VASRKTRRPVLAALAALLVAALAATGCVSMPTGGPVTSYAVTQGPTAQDQPYVQIVPQPPGAGWKPTQIVQGFLTASASFGNYSQVARQYLTPELSKDWNPYWSAIEYETGPTPTAPTYSPAGTKNPTQATVRITGTRQALLLGNGSFSVASSSSSSSAASPVSATNFTLSKVNGQWRISEAPLELLLTSDSFNNDYQLRNLYFFDPAERYLVPDPVYVPLRANTNVLMNGLVGDLKAPPSDWLSGATKTAFPKGTSSDVTLDGVTAVVNLTGSAITKAAANSKTGPQIMEQVSAQLLSTLSASAAQSGSTGQGVQSVEVKLNGKPWIPPGAQGGNPVQRTGKWNPAPGTSPQFYYVDSQGNLTSRSSKGGQPASLAKIGTGYTQIAVSPDGLYVAALRGSTLYTGLVSGGALTKRPGSYMAMSWDHSDHLWASQGDEIVEFRGTSARQPLGQPVGVNVQDAPGGSFTALAVAPDGVRVAIVIAGNELTFGAISGRNGASPQIALSQVQLSPVNATRFTGLTWYGPDDVITLAEPGPVVTEYPVSGGNSQAIPSYQGIQTITAGAKGQPLIAGLPGGHMATDASLTGSWIPLDYDGISPTYPGASILEGS